MNDTNDNDYLEADLNRSGASQKRLEAQFEEELKNDLASIEEVDIPEEKFLFEVNYMLNYIEPEEAMLMITFTTEMPNIEEVNQKIIKGDQRLLNKPNLLRNVTIKPINPNDEKAIQDTGSGVQYF